MAKVICLALSGEEPVKIKTDYMRVKAITTFVKAMEDARDQLRKEADAGDLYSGLQADVLDPIIHNMNLILYSEDAHK